jgi:hypothetical protein
MTRAEIVEKLAELKTRFQLNDAITHPAFDLFVAWMRDRSHYKNLEVCMAWDAFRDGWDAA